MPTNRREAWSPAKRAAAREAARVQWDDERQKAGALATRTLGQVRKAVERDPALAAAIVAAVSEAADEAQP